MSFTAGMLPPPIFERTRVPKRQTGPRIPLKHISYGNHFFGLFSWPSYGYWQCKITTKGQNLNVQWSNRWWMVDSQVWAALTPRHALDTHTIRLLLPA